MNCNEIKQLMSEFIDGELDTCRCAEIKDHIEQCENCQEIFKSFQQTISLCKEYLKTDMPDDIRSRLRERLKNEYFKMTAE